MPDEAMNDLDIVQRGAVMVGARPPTSFTDSSAEAVVAVQLYEDMVREILTAGWNFCGAQVQLSRDTNTPLVGYNSIYILPPDMDILVINNVYVDGTGGALHDIYNNRLHVDAGVSSVVVIDYQKRVDVAQWMPIVKSAAAKKVGAFFASSIVKNASMAKLLGDEAEILLRKARAIDSQQVTAKKFRSYRVLGARRGGR